MPLWELFLMNVERRKHKRFKVQGDAVAVLSRSPDVAGQIVNISEGGISFRYVASRQRSDESPRLNLLASNEKVSSKSMPFKCVWDSPTTDVFSFSFGRISTRCCGLNFGDLTDDEKLELKKFIQNLTTPDKKS